MTAALATGPGRVARRGPAAAAVCACLVAAAAASAREPDHGVRPYAAAERGVALDAPVERVETIRLQSGMPELTTAEPGSEIADEPQSTVRSAAWFEGTDGHADDPATDVRDLLRVVQISGDAEGAAAPSRGTALDSVSTAPAGGAGRAAPESPGRLAWPESSGRIDPEQTLRDWAEGAGLLLGFAVVSLWLVRQWVSRRAQPGGPTTHLRTIESLSLPQRCRIHLVEVQGRQVLVASDAAGVKSVTVLPDRFASVLDPDEAEAALQLARTTAAAEPEHRRDWGQLHEARPT